MTKPQSSRPPRSSTGHVIVGRLLINPRGFGFVEPAEGSLDAVFVPRHVIGRLLAGDLVRATVSEGTDGRTIARTLELVERARRELFGEVVRQGSGLALSVDRQVSAADWALAVPRGQKLEVGDVVVAEIDGERARPVRTVRDADRSLERVVVRYELRTEFPAEVERAAETAARALMPTSGGGRRAPGFELAGRRDLRDMPTVTIDAPVSMDLDDAVAALPADPDGAVRVLVSIADVDALVPAESSVDAEARLRGTSVYLAGRVVPMLPRSLSEQGLSLLPGIDRPTLTVELRIDPEGEVTSIDLYESVIRSAARLSYTDVAAFIDGRQEDAVPESVRTTLRWLRTAAARIATVRAARGGVELLREEAYVTLDPATGEPTDLDARTDTSAHKLIERLMVAANEAVASWLTDRGLPGVFRVHEAPTPERVEALAAAAQNLGFEAGLGPELTPRGLASLEHQFAQTAQAPAMYTILGRALGPARYTVHCAPHFGLGAPRYVHFTSPIRRYADLAVHRVVKDYLRGGRGRFAGERALEELSMHVNACAARATRAENERLRMLAARLFASRKGESFLGSIVDIRPFGLVVQLPGTGVSGTLALDALPDGPYRIDAHRHALTSEHRTFSVGQPLEVVIGGADESLGRIELLLTSARPSRETPRRSPRPAAKPPATRTAKPPAPPPATKARPAADAPSSDARGVREGGRGRRTRTRPRSKSAS